MLKKCLGEIERMCAAFLWSRPEMSTTKAKVSWLEICKKKDEGGLGVRPLTEVNEVACLKSQANLENLNRSELLMDKVDPKVFDSQRMILGC